MQLSEADFDGMLAAMQLIERMCNNGIPLLLDYEGKIVSEYNRYFEQGSTQRRILTKLMTSSAVEYRSGTPTSKCANGLSQDGFDPSDLAYVGVAEHGAGCFVTHEEKHLRIERCEACLAHCGVEIKGSQQIEELAATKE